MAAQLDEHQVYQGVDGKPLVDGYLYIGIQGADPKLSPAPIFADRDLTIALANPQRLDAFGRAANKIWVPGRYSWLVENVNNVQQSQALDAGEEPVAGVTTLSNVQGLNSITAQAIPAITSYVANQTYVFTAVAANTGPVTLDAGGGPLPIRKDYGQELVAGEVAAGQVIMVTYSAANNIFQVPGPSITPLYVWEPVGTFLPNGQLEIEVFHDGISNAGADFMPNYDYRIDYREIFTSINSNFITFDLFENGAYRQGAGEYLNSSSRTVTTVFTPFSTTGTYGFASGSQAGTSRVQSHTGTIELLNLASTSIDSQWRGSSYSLPDASVEYGDIFGKVFGSNLLRASTKLRLTAISNVTPATFLGGTFTLWRRRNF